MGRNPSRHINDLHINLSFIVGLVSQTQAVAGYGQLKYLFYGVLMRETTNEAEAIRTVHNYIDGLNTDDEKKIGESLHFPHSRCMKDGTIHQWSSAGEYLDGFKRRLEAVGWGHTKLYSLETETISDAKTHVKIEFARFKKSGELISNYKSLYIIVYEKGYWGIKFGSGTG
jgi:hypothetical protein